MLKRDVWNTLIEWKNRNHHPLVIRGLRQIGKTFIVRKFGEEFYESCIYLDLRSNTSVHKAFSGDFNIDDMTLAISAIDRNARFIPHKTLLILDEIQDCANARSSLKYWDLDKRYDVICTGSFLGVKGFRTPYTRGIPVGYEEQIIMHPLSFHEFLINFNLDPKILNYVSECLNNKKMIEQTVHESLMKLYLQYLIVGGMPEAVNTFFNTHDINQVQEIQKQILSSIRDDFGRYKDSNNTDKVNETLKLRAEACLNSLPAQLSKEYKKFQYSKVIVNGHSPEKADGLQYLEDVGLVIRSFNTRQLHYPLSAEVISDEFKVFFTDTGLLVSQLGDDTAKLILNGDLGAYKGAIAENMVASAFSNEDKQLFYFHDKSGSPELDFLFEDKSNVVIVECKSSNNRATSMKFVLSNSKKFGTHPAIKIANANVGIKDNFTTYPLYYLGFLPKKPKTHIIEAVDVKNIKLLD